MNTPTQAASAPRRKKGPSRYPTRSSRGSAELGWTTGLDLQRAWGIRPACSRRAAPAYIPTNSPHS